MRLKLVFSGGAELLLGNTAAREHTVELPAAAGDGGSCWRLADLLPWIRDNMIKNRSELLIQEGSVRPGILVLVNDVDWDLCDRLQYRLQQDDTITFISTLHGG